LDGPACKHSATALLPFSCTTVAWWVFGWPEGDSFPTAIFAGFGTALIVAFSLARWTAFAPVERVGQAVWVLLGITAFDVITFSLAQFI